MIELSKLKICFLVGTLERGGIERQLLYILKALSQVGSKVKVMSLTKGDFLEDEVKKMDIPIIWIGQKISWISRLYRLIKELKKDLPHIINSEHFYTNLYAAISARILGIREVGTIRNDLLSEIREIGIFFGNLSLHLPRVLAVNSQSAINTAILKGVNKDKLIFFPNVVDTEKFQPLYDHHNREDIHILSIGRLCKQKRLDRFLNVLSQICRQSNVKIKGIIVGEGELEEELKKIAENLGLLPEKVEFKGAVSDVVSIYQNADIFVLTSDYEGTPNVILEAMSCGLVVVSTKVGGVGEIIQHNITGYLIEPHREEEMVKILNILIKNPQLRQIVGMRAREHIKRNYSLKQIFKNLENLYERVITKYEK